MAYTHETHTAPSLMAAMRRFFSNLSSSFSIAATANARLTRMERLNALTDEELAEIGLRREDIARHVFRDILYL